MPASVLAHCSARSLIFEDTTVAADLALLFSVSFIFFIGRLRTLDAGKVSDDECELRRTPKRARRERQTQDAERSGPDGAPSRASTRAGTLPRSAGPKAQAQPREATLRDRSARSRPFPAPESAVYALASGMPASSSRADPKPSSRRESHGGTARGTGSMDSSASGSAALSRHASEPITSLERRVAKTRTRREELPPDRFIRTPMKYERFHDRSSWMANDRSS